MFYRILADGILIFHLCFILFVVFGGLLVVRWRRVIWLHLPAVGWAFLVQWFAWICPLTPLEIGFRQMSGEAGYEGGFIEHYIVALLYINPGPRLHTLIALFVVFLNLLVYIWIFNKWRKKSGYAKIDQKDPKKDFRF